MEMIAELAPNLWLSGPDNVAAYILVRLLTSNGPENTLCLVERTPARPFTPLSSALSNLTLVGSALIRGSYLSFGWG